MKTYKHLTSHERDRIAVWRSRGLSLRDIAKKVGRHFTTLCRELNRNRGRRGYWPHKAEERAQRRRHQDHKRIRLKSRVLRYEVEQMLIKGWSPELIAGRICKHRKDLPPVSHETIYQWIYNERPDLVAYLLHAHPKRRKRWKVSTRKVRIPERVSIQQRPLLINERQEVGHWETDLIVGSGRAALQVSVERRSRLTRVSKIASKTAGDSRVSLQKILSGMPPQWRRSITYDNGSENVEHMLLNRILGTSSWFCQPYHSWEKGQVENTNGIIRRFVPKRTNLDNLPDHKIKTIENWLNNRPRKVLNYKTSNEVFKDYCCT